MPILTTLGAACAKAWGFTSGLITDQYFNLVSLLLPGNGTNGAQNNTFLDSSTNNFTITRNPTAGPNAPTQGTFSPFSQTGWGNYFNGSSALTMPNSTAFKPGSSDFSIELWYFGAASAAQQYIWGDTDSATNNGVIALRINPTSNVAVDYFTSSTAATSRTTTGTINANAWNHICVSKTGTTLYIGINGVLETFVGPSSMQSPATVNPAIGRLGAYTAGGYLTGYISNFRYVVGSALYTTNPYTVPKNNLTAISGTSLLTCQSNRFVDNSGTPLTITPNGNTSVVAFSPFAPTQSYSASAVGGSGYFDGTGDYLTVADNTALDMEASDFTMEAWIYPTTSFSANGALFSKRASNAVFGGVLVLFGGSNAPTFRATSTNSSWDLVNSTSSVSVIPSQWNHIAIARSGGNWALWVNGNRGVSATGVTGTVSNNTAAFGLGANADGSESFPIPVYVAGARVVKGTAVYDPTSSSITVPTAPLTAITNTSLLLNFTNAGVVDATAKNVLETVGNAQISTSVSKFGGGSIALDGTGDGLFSDASPTINAMTLGTGDFCIEFWVYFNSLSGTPNLLDMRPVATQGVYPSMYVDTSKVSIYVNSATLITGTTTMSTGQWYHIAWSRISGQSALYVGGTRQGASSTADTNNYLCSRVVFGIDRGLSANPVNGYFDDIRITKGNGRGYTGASITVPTAPFPVQ